MRSSWMQEPYRMYRETERQRERERERARIIAIDIFSAVRKSKTNPLSILRGSGEHINFCSVPNRINNGIFF